MCGASHASVRNHFVLLSYDISLGDRKKRTYRAGVFQKTVSEDIKEIMVVAYLIILFQKPPGEYEELLEI
jgi:hypothetical protein